MVPVLVLVPVPRRCLSTGSGQNGNRWTFTETQQAHEKIPNLCYWTLYDHLPAGLAISQVQTITLAARVWAG